MIVKTKELKQALSWAGNFINTRSPTEVLKHVCLRSVGNRLRIETTGHGGVFHGYVESDSPEELTAWVKYEDFSGVVGKLSGDLTSLSASGNRLSIACGKTKVALPIFDDSKAWAGDSLEEGQGVAATVAAEDLCDMVQSVYFASPKFSIDFSLTVYLDKSGDKLWAHAASNAVGAFTHRLSQGDDFGVAAPADALKRACACLTAQGIIEIKVGDSIQLCGESVSIRIPATREGAMITPHYRKHVEKMLDKAVRWGISRSDISDFIKVADMLTTEDCIAIYLTPKGDHALAEYKNDPVAGGGTAFATGSTETELEGDAPENSPGGKCSVKNMIGAVAHSTEEGFYFADGSSAFFVCSDKYMSYVTKMGSPAS